MHIKSERFEFDRSIREFTAQAGPVQVHADWRERAFGLSVWGGCGRVSGCVDWFAPMGEPNRLYVTGLRWRYMIGLPDNRVEEFEDTGTVVLNGREIPSVRSWTVRGRWRLVRGQRWTRTGGWSQGDDWTWFVWSPCSKA